ncbi:hypothetical protein [Bacteroides pyogenes]|uniref:Lipocalin family protein n=3 Tax=Bacteroides pyogenes TaxID=310300 RepID=A0A5D3FLK1_9BACE|nr:hypothetical protein [Bacteroides pyogenes]GAE14182.1 hypothetical protein JCM6292_282 [Bacteroides pyogenes JCM 6292]MDY4249613.1 hypothetical protein [Bacteroides pyogenes]TYK33588.1 hypothetical protein FNJ60_07395 [Bacteroides pyogenes]TYK39295.1 hypothetical protein FNJ61_03725 [Bacteroides pyogenes]TYK41791.1 hypothetical protein FNJ59_02525 [Bacteroides pyogenes]
MKKYTFLILLTLLFIGCDKKEEELGELSLVQTVWNGERISYEDGEEVRVDNLWLFFKTESEVDIKFGEAGRYNNLDYSFKNKVVHFGLNTKYLVGDWVITNRTQNTLQLTYGIGLPKYSVLTLTKVY